MIIKIKNYSNYCGPKSHNGGNYLTWTVFTQKNNSFIIEYHSSSENDFDYCSILGEYQSCNNCFYNRKGKCIAPKEVIKLEELIKRICQACENPYEEIIMNGEIIKRAQLHHYNCGYCPACGWSIEDEIETLPEEW